MSELRYPDGTPFAAPPYKTCFQFAAGDISPEAWNRKRLSYPRTHEQLTEKSGRKHRGSKRPRAPRGGNNMLDTAIGHAGVSGNSRTDGGDGSRGQLWRFFAGHEIPTMNEQGEFEFFHDNIMHDTHCMVMPQQAGRKDLGGFNQLTQLIPTLSYKTTFRSRLVTEPSTFNVPWLLHWQSGSHHISLYVKRGFWATEILKTVQAPINRISVEKNKSYEFEIDITYSDTDGEAYTSIKVDGKPIVQSDKANFDNGRTGLAQTWGNYQSRNTSRGALIVGQEFKIEYREAA